MQIELIPTLAIMLFLPFVVAFFAMRQILFVPLLAYLEERQTAIEGARHDAERLDHDVVARTVELEKKLQAARDEVATARAAARKRAAEQQSAILSEARHRAEKRVAQAVVEIEAERAKAGAAMKPLAAELARDVASSVLGRPVA